ncbi:MAG: hypothetical protein PHQ43_03590 [Dehalococcoidales bacterium]|nr:hypothetical protein [Dehalococcoidales bacterium]
MAKTKAQLNQAARTYLDEAVQADWEETEVNREVNNGYHEVVTAVIETFDDYYLTEATADTVVDQQEYRLPSDFFKVRRVEINYDVDNSGSRYQRALPVSLDQVRRDLGNENAGITVLTNPAYFLQGNYIGFIPVPTNVGTDAIKIWYVRQVSDLDEDSDTVDIPYPDRFAKLIPMYAAGVLLKKGQEAVNEGNDLLNQFYVGIERMKQQLEDRIADENKSVIDTRMESIDFSRF